jgi:hypothetical protein
MVLAAVAETSNILEVLIITKTEFEKGLFSQWVPHAELLFVITGETAGIIVQHHIGSYF